MILSTKKLKEGEIPESVNYESNNEIGELVNHYNELLHRLKENNQLRRKMVTDLSHEVRTPIQNLNGYLYAIKNGDIEQNEVVMESLFNESERLKHLIEQLDQLKEWDLAKHNVILDKSTVEISNLIRRCVSIFQWKFDQVHISIDLKLDEDLIELQEEGIQQVINNLLDNAYRYHEGSDPVQIHGKKHEDYYEFSIISKGQPIAPTDQEEIF
ncbi:two-component sensor histidine kinase [Piscibacillus salipiscarius]|uniref:two-component sensor histidine kinase n=1 Tax=Piscibacillus salipiscarius TaxID=299480 RepID=UPI0006D1D838|nr:two-component sensor histidine kinase [Piscibacillus salipiscarius]